MPVLANARHEQFAQRAASGQKLLDAYVSVGYSKAGAQSSASRLASNAKVRARIAELQAAAEQTSLQAILFDKQRVLSRLDGLGKKAEADGRLSDAIRCEELIGRSRGLFVDKADHTFKWSGRLEDLSDAQLEMYEKSVASKYGLDAESGPVNGKAQ
jgi:hypothetical protein